MSQRRFVGDESCRSCHAAQFQSYVATAHANTSVPASDHAIHGNFQSGSNRLRTGNPDLHFEMERRADGHFETAILRTSNQLLTRSERIDVVIGSGRKGQTYLFWDDNRLFQLPVSYWSETHAWVNSPGYIDGEAKFDRPVERRCLECHATRFEWAGPPENAYLKSSVVLGLSCEKCHGPGSEHVERFRLSTPPKTPADFAIINPARLPRDRQIDTCALCHAGLGKAHTPPLSFRPGDKLADHLSFARQLPGAHIDVHASQVQLLERSRCFQASPQMSCTTCHDVHKPQRDLAAMAASCIQCHTVESCGEFPHRGRSIATGCVECHMPLEQTAQIVIEGSGAGTMQPRVRSHRIAIYRDSETRDN